MSPDSTFPKVAPRLPCWLAVLLLSALAVCAPAIAQDEDLADEERFQEVIDLKPEDLASFGMKNLVAPFGSLFPVRCTLAVVMIPRSRSKTISKSAVNSVSHFSTLGIFPSYFTAGAPLASQLEIAISERTSRIRH